MVGTKSYILGMIFVLLCAAGAEAQSRHTPIQTDEDRRKHEETLAFCTVQENRSSTRCLRFDRANPSVLPPVEQNNSSEQGE